MTPGSILPRSWSIRNVARDAATNQAVQQNFLEFLRLLAFGITDILGVVTQQEILPLARNREVVGVAWRAATAHGLQPRTRGSLVEIREVLSRAAQTEEHLPLPHWWTEERDNEADAAEAPPG